MTKISGEVDRRAFLGLGAKLGGAAMLGRMLDWPGELSGNRPQPSARRFTSPAIEETIQRVSGRIADPTLARMFECCFPNTLDTTVFPGQFDGKPDTFVITGDIDAMWLRDSSAQVWPYLPFMKQDASLERLIEGVIRRQTRQILLDPYANAFLRSPHNRPLSWSVHDRTRMLPGIGERKWEIDSLCYPVRLSHAFWKKTGRTDLFDEQWHRAAELTVTTFRQQQRKASRGPYCFQRASLNPYDTLALDGYGNPARPNGMIFSMFRPSDDACIYPLFVPANLFAVKTLHRLREMAAEICADRALAAECGALADEVDTAIRLHAIVEPTNARSIWAYEVDGYGNALLMDDANVPSLLGLPYLECCDSRDPLYLRTRDFVLSDRNPWFFRGSAGEGIGGPHIGMNYAWPISIAMRALTSHDTEEIAVCLRTLRNTTAGTDYMHESFDVNDPARYTRPWFAWANSLFGELILKVEAEHPALLQRTY
jgi:hypothetical protein